MILCGRRNKAWILLLPFFVIVFLQTRGKVLSTEFINALLQSQLKIFTNCHIAFITLEWIPNADYKSWRYASGIIDRILVIFSKNNFTTFSVERYRLFNRGRNLSRVHRKKRFILSSPKYTNCLTHAYIPHHSTSQYLHNLTGWLRKDREWPNHFIFVESLDSKNPAITTFYKSLLPLTFVRGIVLTLDIRMARIRKICIPCSWQLQFKGYRGRVHQYINLTQYTNLHNAYLESAYLLHSNLHMAPVITNIDENPPKRHFCDFMSTLREYFYSPEDCLPFLLEIKFNFTAMPFDRENQRKLFSIRPFPLTTRNLGHPDYENKKKRWLLLGKFSKVLQFVALQKRQGFSGNALIKPFDWKGWSLIASSACCILLVTLAFAYIHSENYLGLSSLPHLSVFITIIASSLDQPMTGNFQVSGKTTLFKSEVLAKTWLVWIVALLVIVNGYKGFIYAFIISGSSPIWPVNLRELVSDDDYCIFETDWTVQSYALSDVFIGRSSQARGLLKPLMIGVPGVNYPAEYFKLNASLITVAYTEREAVSTVIQQNPSVRDTFAKFEIDGEKCLKFAFLHDNQERVSIPLLYYLEDLLMSDALTIPKLVIYGMILVDRNFFTEPFSRGVVSLEQAGILEALGNRNSKMATCREVKKHGECLKTRGDARAMKHVNLRCQTQVTGSSINPNELREVARPVAMRLNQFHAVNYFCLVGTTIAFLVYIFENYEPIILRIKLLIFAIIQAVWDCITTKKFELSF